MPPAHVCTPLLINAALNAQMQAKTSQAQLQNAAAQNQMSSLMQSPQGQMGIAQSANYLGAQLGATFPVAAVTLPPVNSGWHKQQAKLLVDAGDKIVGRFAFWREIPVIGPWRINRLADQLEQISDSIERELERA